MLAQKNTGIKLDHVGVFIFKDGTLLSSRSTVQYNEHLAIRDF